MPRRLVAVMLAGTLRPSPLREQLDVPVLCLPMGRQGMLLDAWLACFRRVPELRQVLVVVNDEADVEAHDAAVSQRTSVGDALRVQTLVEPTAWRGPAGILHDVSTEFEDDNVVIAVEAGTLPPASLVPLVQPLLGDKSGVVNGAVGVCGDDEPSGSYAFTVRALRESPEVGFHDVKEQLLPKLHGRGMRVTSATIGKRTQRLRDREGYLASVQTSLESGSDSTEFHRVSAHASVSGSAVLDGFCIVERGAVIEDGAVLHDSVVMNGATIGGGAVASRCLVGPLASIEPRSRVVHEVIASRQAVGKTRPVERPPYHMERQIR